MAVAAAPLAGTRLCTLLPRFYGRTALFEVLPITPVIRQLISANTDVESLETHARQAGMCTLLKTAAAVEQGLTTFEELIRVLGMPHGE